MTERYQQNSLLEDPQPTKEPRRRQLTQDQRLREVIAPYMDVPKLCHLASDHERLEDALRTGDIPEEISWLLSLLTTVLARLRGRGQLLIEYEKLLLF